MSAVTNLSRNFFFSGGGLFQCHHFLKAKAISKSQLKEYLLKMRQALKCSLVQKPGKRKVAGIAFCYDDIIFLVTRMTA